MRCAKTYQNLEEKHHNDKKNFKLTSFSCVWTLFHTAKITNKKQIKTITGKEPNGYKYEVMLYTKSTKYSKNTKY